MALIVLSLAFQSPSCEQPINVMLLRMDGADEGRLPDPRPADDVVKYDYLGLPEENWNKTAMIRQSVWASILFTVGLRAVNRRGSPPMTASIIGMS